MRQWKARLPDSSIQRLSICEYGRTSLSLTFKFETFLDADNEVVWFENKYDGTVLVWSLGCRNSVLNYKT